MSLVTMVTVLMQSTCGHFQICVHFETSKCFNNSGKYLCVVLVTVCGISVHPNWSNMYWTNGVDKTHGVDKTFVSQEATNHWGI